MNSKETTQITALNGNTYTIPAEQADLFFDGRTGQPITDEQWDEQMTRLRAHDPEFEVS